MGVGEFLVDWINDREQDMKRNTWQQYQPYLDVAIDTLGNYRLSKLRVVHVGELLEKFDSPSRANKMRNIMRAALNDAMRQQLVTVNVAAHTRPRGGTERSKPLVWSKAREAEWRKDPDAPRPSPSMVWRVDHVRAFLAATADDELLPLWHLMAHTGARRGEALGLQWDDIDAEASCASLERAIVCTPEGIVVSTPKTQSGARTIALTQTTLDVLARHREKMVERYGDDTSTPPWVFPHPDGGVLDPNLVRKHFARAVKAANLPPIRLHDLRHTAASLMLAAGVDMKTVSETLGHSRINVTMDTYASVYDDAHAAAAEAIGKLLG
jgi:integrase